MDPVTIASSLNLCRCEMLSSVKWPMIININTIIMISGVMLMPMWWMITRPRGGKDHFRDRDGAQLWVTRGWARAPPITASRPSTATQVRHEHLLEKVFCLFLHNYNFIAIGIICTMWVARNWFLYIMQCFGPCLTKICCWLVFMVAAQAQVMICVGGVLIQTK